MKERLKRKEDKVGRHQIENAEAARVTEFIKKVSSTKGEDSVRLLK
jgi:hypothetical protein